MFQTRRLAVALAICTMTLFVGCGGTGPGSGADSEGCLEVLPAQQTVSSSSGSTSISISNPCDGTMNWSASESWDWISLSNNNGVNSGTVEVQYIDNSTESGRTCTITVTAPGASGSPKQVTITQEGQGPIPCLEVPQLQFQVWCGSGSTTITVSNSCGGAMDWYASESCDWVSLSGSSGVNNGTIGVHYSENPNASGRMCTITVTAPGATGSPYELNIIQEGCGPCGC
jgi:hypothetical protein